MGIKDLLMTFLEDNLFLKNGTCPICGKVLFVTGNFLCGQCLTELPVISGPNCESCGRPMFSQKQRCRVCRKENLPFTAGYAWLHYHQSGKALVHAIKFRDRPSLGVWAGTRMGEELSKKPWIRDLDFIIPVPLHPDRLEERGYNQSEKIARGILAGLTKDFLSNEDRELNEDRKSDQGTLPEIKPEYLRRSRNTPHQIGQTRDQRLTNLTGAFSPEHLKEFQGKTILLVDDVLTTGATLAEAGAALLEAGAKEVYIAVICGVAE